MLICGFNCATQSTTSGSRQTVSERMISSPWARPWILPGRDRRRDRGRARPAGPPAAAARAPQPVPARQAGGGVRGPGSGVREEAGWSFLTPDPYAEACVLSLILVLL